MLWITGDTVLHDGVRQVADRLDVGTALLHPGCVRFAVTGPVRCTMTAKDAVALCRLVRPQTAIPIHYEGGPTSGRAASRPRPRWSSTARSSCCSGCRWLRCSPRSPVTTGCWVGSRHRRWSAPPGCGSWSARSPTVSPSPRPSCRRCWPCTQLEELWLEAQAVPSASHIPCVQALPADIIGALAVRDGESVLELSHASLDISLGERPRVDAAAGSVTIRLTATCAVPTTGEGRTLAPGVRRFQIEGPASTPQVVDVVLGGCGTYQPEPGIGPSAPLLDQAQRVVTYRTRDELRSDATLAGGSSLTPKAPITTTGPRAGCPHRSARRALVPNHADQHQVSLTAARLGGPIGRMEKLSLDALARELTKSATAAPAGRSARTVYGGHEHVLRQTLIALTAGSTMSEHENPGEATVQVLHGRVRLAADAADWEGRDGDLLIVPRERHTLHALEDATVLLTVAKLA